MLRKFTTLYVAFPGHSVQKNNCVLVVLRVFPLVEVNMLNDEKNRTIYFFWASHLDVVNYL